MPLKVTKVLLPPTDPGGWTAVKIIRQNKDGTYLTGWKDDDTTTNEPKKHVVGTGLLDVFHINKDAEKKLKSKNENYYIVELKHEFGSGTHGRVIVDFHAKADLHNFCNWDYDPPNDSNNNYPIKGARITIHLPMAEKHGIADAWVDCEVVKVVKDTTAAIHNSESASNNEGAMLMQQVASSESNVVVSSTELPAVPHDATRSHLMAWVRDSRDPAVESHHAFILNPYSSDDEFVFVEWDSTETRKSVHKDQIVTIYDINDNRRPRRVRSTALEHVNSNNSAYDESTVDPSNPSSHNTSPPPTNPSPLPDTILSNNSTAALDNDDDDTTVGSTSGINGPDVINGPIINTPAMEDEQLHLLCSEGGNNNIKATYAAFGGGSEVLLNASASTPALCNDALNGTPFLFNGDGDGDGWGKVCNSVLFMYGMSHVYICFVVLSHHQSTIIMLCSLNNK